MRDFILIFKNLFINLFLIEVQLIYNIVFVLGIQQSNQLYTHTHIYMSIYFPIFFHSSLLQDIEYSSLWYTVNPYCLFYIWQGTSLVAQMIKNPPRRQETQVQSLAWEDPWRRAWQPTLVFLPGESHEQRSLVGYGPWSCKELGTTERLSTAPSTAHLLIPYSLESLPSPSEMEIWRPKRQTVATEFHRLFTSLCSGDILTWPCCSQPPSEVVSFPAQERLCPTPVGLSPSTGQTRAERCPGQVASMLQAPNFPSSPERGFLLPVLNL